MGMSDLETKRKDRKKTTGEDFTPPWLIDDMLAKLPQSAWAPSKTFIDPAAGNGNMLIQVLWRKISRGHDPLEALWTIYGIDIMQDNVRECRLRLLKTIQLHEPLTEEHVKAVFTNVIHLNSKKYPKGALQYDFSFPKAKYTKNDVARWMELIEKGALEEVSLPVSEASFGKRNRDIFSKPS